MGPIKKEVSEMKKIKFVPIARTKGVCDNEKDIEENGMEVLSKNDQRMTLLRGHLCHPFRAYFTCRIATFLCCEGCDFPGRWLLFGRIFELKMKKASKWLGIQISSLERNLRTSGFKMVSDSILTGSRVYIFPFNQQVTRAKEQVEMDQQDQFEDGVESNDLIKTMKEKIRKKSRIGSVNLKRSNPCHWIQVNFEIHCRHVDCIAHKKYLLTANMHIGCLYLHSIQIKGKQFILEKTYKRSESPVLEYPVEFGMDNSRIKEEHWTLENGTFRSIHHQQKEIKTLSYLKKQMKIKYPSIYQSIAMDSKYLMKVDESIILQSDTDIQCQDSTLTFTTNSLEDSDTEELQSPSLESNQMLFHNQPQYPRGEFQDILEGGFHDYMDCPVQNSTNISIQSSETSQDEGLEQYSSTDSMFKSFLLNYLDDSDKDLKQEVEN